MSRRPPDRVGAEPVAAIAVALACAAAAVGSAGCRVNQQAFDQRVFTCDTAAADPGCGKDSTGNPMTCFPASQLDGADFCTESCVDPMSLPDEDAVCVQGGALLKACNPDDTTTPGGPCGRSDLGCLRTDVTRDEGVCMTMQPCTHDTDCPNPVRSTCAATFLKNLYPNDQDPTTGMHADNLYCLQEGCVSGGSSCAAGQSCLPKLIPPAAHPPDICVPNCDSKLRCPPNHFCYRKLTNDSNPAICIPGLLGFVCETDVDCLVGQCMSDGETDPNLALNLCTISCVNDGDCQKLNSVQGKFICLNGQCATPDAYRGSSCYVDTDCTREHGETVCVYTHIRDKNDPTDQGTCLVPCGTDGSCAPRGGFGQGCVPFDDPSGTPTLACYPGYFGVPCLADSNCIPGLICGGLDASNPGVPGFCTATCDGDPRCAGNQWTANQTFCGLPSVPLCIPLLADGKPCDIDTHCASGRCIASPSADGGTADGGTAPKICGATGSGS